MQGRRPRQYPPELRASVAARECPKGAYLRVSAKSQVDGDGFDRQREAVRRTGALEGATKLTFTEPTLQAMVHAGGSSVGPRVTPVMLRGHIRATTSSEH